MKKVEMRESEGGNMDMWVEWSITSGSTLLTL